MKPSSIFALALAASLSVIPSARADVPPPNLAGCDMKKAGDACVNDDDKDGTCVQQTCSKLDYSDGSPPSSVDYDCVLCSGPAGPTTGSTTGSTTGGTTESESCGFALPGAAAGSMGAGAAIAATLLLMRRRRRS